MRNDKSKNSGGGLLKIITSPGASVVMFLLAAGLLLFAGIGVARAALTYFSDTYTSRYGMYDIGVSLLESAKEDGDYEIVSYRNYKWKEQDGSWDEATGRLLDTTWPVRKDKDGNTITDEDGKALKETLKIGKAYPEYLKVRNTGNINQFVRVSLYKYWTDAEGNKTTALAPGAVTVQLANSDSWLLDKAASTDERTVVYYNKLLDVNKDTVPLTQSVTVDKMVAKKITQSVKKSEDGQTITTTYDYDGYGFVIEAVVDAVQEHNAQDAIVSAWGRNVTVSGKTLSLK